MYHGQRVGISYPLHERQVAICFDDMVGNSTVDTFPLFIDSIIKSPHEGKIKQLIKLCSLTLGDDKISYFVIIFLSNTKNFKFLYLFWTIGKVFTNIIFFNIDRKYNPFIYRKSLFLTIFHIQSLSTFLVTIVGMQCMT